MQKTPATISTDSAGQVAKATGHSTPLPLDISEPENLSFLPRELTLREAAPFLIRLVREPAFSKSWNFPFLERAGRTGDWYVARRYEASYSLQVFVWPPGSGTRIHDHSSWGVLCCALGSLLEERYERLDDGSRPNRARLKRSRRRMWRKEDGVSTVLPYDGGIHRIENPSGRTAVSVHIYGPRAGELDGRDYEPSRDYVCDRRND